MFFFFFLYIWCMQSIIILVIVHVIFHLVLHSLGYTVVIGHTELKKYGPSACFFFKTTSLHETVTRFSWYLTLKSLHIHHITRLRTDLALRGNKIRGPHGYLCLGIRGQSHPTIHLSLKRMLMQRRCLWI